MNLGREQLGKLMLGTTRAAEGPPSTYVHAQAQAKINSFDFEQFGQALADILQVYRGYAQTQGFISKSAGYGQAQAQIKQTYRQFAQANSRIKLLRYQFGQAQGFFGHFRPAQATAEILSNIHIRCGQAQAKISEYRVSQAPVEVIVLPDTANVLVSQAPTEVIILVNNANIRISQTPVEVIIKLPWNRFAQAEAKILVGGVTATYAYYAQALAWITRKEGYSNARAYIKIRRSGLSQAQAYIGHMSFGLARAFIEQVTSKIGQAQAYILTKIQTGQTQAHISVKTFAHAQSVAHITNRTPNAQAQAFMNLHLSVAQANAQIGVVAKAIVTQDTLEAAVHTTSGKARVTQTTIESIRRASPKSRVTQTVIEVMLRPIPEPKARLGQAVIEVILTRNPTLSQGRGQAQARIAATTYVKDTFTRTTSVGVIGSPDIGPDYSGGDVSDIYVDGTDLILNTSIVGRDLVKAISPISVADTQASLEFETSDLTTAFETEIATRYSTSNDDRVVAWINSLTPANGFNIGWYNNPNSATTSTAFTYQSNTFYVIKLRAEGSTLKGKIWKRTDVEPDWMLTLTSIGRTATGQAYFYLEDLTSATAVIKADNWFVANPHEAIFIPQFAQVEAVIYKLFFGQGGQAQALIHRFQGYSQAEAYITRTEGYAQALAWIDISMGHSQAQAHIIKFVRKYAQGQSQIKTTYVACGQANSWITRKQGYGQSQGYIYRSIGFGQAEAFIHRTEGYGQAQAVIVTKLVYGQVQAYMNIVRKNTGQARAVIIKGAGFGQAEATIFRVDIPEYGQAQAYILNGMAYGQAQSVIRYSIKSIGQAMAFVGHIMTGNAASYIIGGRTYIVKYNDEVLPGYAQQESLNSQMNISDNFAAYKDASLSEYIGLQNKIVSLRMRVWEADYRKVKDSVQKAGTIVRSNREGFARLYIQTMDRYYEAMAKSIEMEKEVRSSMRIADYTVEFECKPWLISEATYTISGTGLINTDQVSRNIYNGGWAPVSIKLSGTNITVSGYTSTGDFAGFISVSGAVNNLIVDSDGYTATINGENKNSIMNNLDYALYVGPGKTNFAVTGATECEITYSDRWYL